MPREVTGQTERARWLTGRVCHVPIGNLVERHDRSRHPVLRHLYDGWYKPGRGDEVRVSSQCTYGHEIYK